MPSAIAGTPARSCEKVCLAPARAGTSSVSPSSRSRPTRTSSRKSSPVGEEWRPIFSIGLEREERQRPALLLAEGPARHDRGGGEADAHAERGHHAGAVAAELDHGDQLHGCRVGRLGTGGALARARLAFLLARDLPLEPCARHLVDAEGRHELPEDRVGRRVAVLELAQVRLDLGLDEAAKGLADQLVLLAPLDHDGLPNSARVFRSMRSRLFSAISAVSRRRSNHWSAVDSALATGSWPAGARSR